MKKHFKVGLLVLAVMMLCVLTLVSCGGDTNENNNGNNSGYQEPLYLFSANEDGSTCSITGVNRNLVTDAKIVLPDKSPEGLAVTSIAYGAFDGDEILTEIVIPSGVTTIGERAFEGCTALTTLTLPDSVTEIKDYAFRACAALENVNMPSGLTTIGTSAFEGTAIKSVNMPDTVTSLGMDAFDDCASLTTITISKNVTEIDTFDNCPLLSSITVSEGNPVYHSSGNCLIETAEKRIMKGSNNSTIPSDGSVTVIGSGAFSGLTEMTSIVIPDCITEIGSSAFSGCTALETVTLPNALTTLTNGMFVNCTSLESVNIPNSVTTIESLVFSECAALKTLYIPASVTSIGVSSWGGRGSDFVFNCPSLVVEYGGTRNDWDAACDFNDSSSFQWEYTVRCVDGLITNDWN